MGDPGYNIRLRSSARTSVGQVRENNEDNIHLWTGERFVLAVVADGMGGAAAGEQASRIAVESIQAGLDLHDQTSQAALQGVAEDDITEKLREVIQDANLSIKQRADREPDMRGMGTTVTMAFVRGTAVIIAHVGDSRAYLVSGRDAEITQITSDHSFVEALLAAGHITREQAEEHPMRHVLYRALGQSEEIDVDVYRAHLQVGDRLVLCSDGLTRHVNAAEIAQLALADDNPDTSSQKLIDLANARGGEDNVSVIVVTVERDVPGAGQDGLSAAYNAEDDQEDTIVLRNRVSFPAKLPQTDKTNARLHPLDHDEDDRLLYKQDAERLSDTLDDDKTPDQPALDMAISSRPLLFKTAAARPDRRPRDGEGEGCDTLLPEQ